MNIGKKIKRVRKIAGMSQEELADKLNVSRQTVSKWETDVTAPDLESALCICELFQLSMDDFLKGDKKIDYDTKFTLQDIIKIHKRSQRMTIILMSGLFFLMIGVLAALFNGALYAATASTQYMLYRYITVGEYSNAPFESVSLIVPPICLVIIGIVLCVIFIVGIWKEKRNEK